MSRKTQQLGGSLAHSRTLYAKPRGLKLWGLKLGRLRALRQGVSLVLPGFVSVMAPSSLGSCE